MVPSPGSRARSQVCWAASWEIKAVSDRQHSSGFDLPKQTFVGTATAIGLSVDGARMPVYLAMQHAEMWAIWPWVALATVGVAIGTVLGSRVLARIPDVWFRRVLAVVLALLGGTMLVRASSP